MIGLVLQPEKARKQIAPREIFCVIEKAYQNISIAEDACLNIFTNAGLRLKLNSIDWTKNPLPSDEEWHIEWSKFYFGLDLAFAFNETGDKKNLKTWQNLVSLWIEQVEIGSDSSDVSARRIQNWIYAWMIFARKNPVFSIEFINQICQSLARQITHLRNNLTPERNHRTLELYSLFVASLALPNPDKSDELLQFSIKQLYENLLTDFQADGVHREQSTHYHMIVLRSFLGVMENAKRGNLNLPEGFAERVEKACEFAMHIHTPVGEIPALSDSDTGSYLDLLELAGVIFERKDFLFVGTKGEKGVPPIERNLSFNESGYHIQRSDWKTDSNFLVFDCGRLGDGGHGHYDLLNVEISANGNPLIVDTGRFTYSEEGTTNWRHFFKGTAAQNTVCVDEKDQINYRRGKPKGELSLGRFIERQSFENLDILCGEAISPNYDTIHTRRIFFVCNDYWIIWDNLRGKTQRKFDLRFHLTPAAWNHVLMTKTGINSIVSTPDLAIVFSRDENVNIEPSWYSPEYGIKHRIPCLSVVSEGSPTKDFFTLIKPISNDEKLPSFQVSSASNVTKIEVSGESLKDILSWEMVGENLEIGQFKRTEVAR